MQHARGMRTESHPAPGFVHAVNLLSPSPAFFYFAMSTLVEWRQQRAQSGEAVRAYQSTKDQFAERFFDHARQKIRARDDIDKEGCAMIFQVSVDSFSVGVKLSPVRFEQRGKRFAPGGHTLSAQENDRRAANRR